jgi:hypothetical protein
VGSHVHIKCMSSMTTRSDSAKTNCIRAGVCKACDRRASYRNLRQEQLRANYLPMQHVQWLWQQLHSCVRWPPAAQHGLNNELIHEPGRCRFYARHLLLDEILLPPEVHIFILHVGQCGM